MFSSLSTRITRRYFGSLIGKPAPTFSANACMPDGSFKTVSLNDYRDKYVVLYFWPADFTYVCSSETIDFHKMAEKFRATGVELLGCSTDTAFVHKAWRSTPKTEGGLGTPVNHPMLADVTKSISKDYEVLLDNGLACRGVFVIDKKGVVRSEMKNDLPLGRNVEEVLRICEALSYVDSHAGEVCPSSWKKGKPAMKASHEGVIEYLTKHT
jgi:alkyl hydroperoxide reductase subunit AhpC